ncbi:MAG: 30S ribosomal protein S12 methylthiotransferase RimO [Oscillospiraceae bacterium]|jgi:ribosomal protein S12 methylthiotransferase|nr:30S ribosomal protein S12 methylthiotransferase RimO [Oscillospiraceae bacterium]
MNSTVALISLGCAKNLVNSEQMLALLRDAGFALVPEPSETDAESIDAVIVNTCGFIESAKTEAIDTILELAELKARGRVGKIIVAGCLAERYRAEMLAELPEADAIVGVGGFGSIVAAVNSALAGERAVFSGKPEAGDDNLPRLVTTPGAWAYLKLADGCDNRCAFCVIPSIRGRYRSRSMEDVLREAESLVQGGARELILIAQDTTRYGEDLCGSRKLAELLRRLNEMEDIRWIRAHYLYPDAIDAPLLGAFASNAKVLPYFDVPIQHINNAILKAMRRRGTGDEARALIRRIRDTVPRAVIRTSLITGLPGEGEAEFEELCAFLREARLERVGVFPYSPEEGTPAFDMPRPERETAEYRAELITDIQSRVMDAFNDSRVGTRELLLTDGYDDGGRALARSYAEAPEVDGAIELDEALPPGIFIHAQIIGHEDGTLRARREETTP